MTSQKAEVFTAMNRFPSRLITSVIISAFLAPCLSYTSRSLAYMRGSYVQEDGRLTLPELEEYVTKHISDSAIATLIRRRKIDFPPTARNLKRLRQLKAGPETMQALLEIRRTSTSTNSISRDRTKRRTTTNAAAHKFIIVVADFRGPDVEKYLVTKKLIRHLQDATADYSDISIQPVKEFITEENGGSKAARDIGTKWGADIVLWGYYGASPTTVDIYVFFEALRKPKVLTKSTYETEWLKKISEFDSFEIQAQLPVEMTSFALMTIGVARLEAGDHTGAIELLTAALDQARLLEERINPGYIYFYRGLAHYFRKDANIDQAIADFDKGIALKPKVAEAYYDRAIFYRKKGRDDLAISDLDKAIGFKVDYAEAYAERGSIYDNTDQDDRAISDYNKAIEYKSDYFPAYYNLGVFYGKRNKYQLAIANFEKVLKLADDYADAYGNLGLFYHKIGQDGRSLAAYNKAITLKRDSRESAPDYNNRANYYSDKKQFDRAIADYKKAIKLMPDYAEAYNNLGILYQDLNQDDNAMINFAAAIRLKPNYSEAYSNRGLLYVKVDRHELAFADYREAIRLNPKLAGAYYNRGLLYRLTHQVDLAIADFAEAIRLKPDFAEAYDHRGLAYMDRSRYDVALADFDKAVEHQPNHAEYYFHRGFANINMDKNDDAMSNFDAAIRLKPNYGRAYYERGILYATKRQYRVAMANFDNAIEYEPDYEQSKAYYFRGIIQELAGNPALAVSDYKTFVNRTTDSDLRHDAEQRLKQIGIK